MAGADEMKYARRVRQDNIRRLYTLDAKGIVDEDLMDDVGYAMLARCESIRIATRAHFGRATCPRCRNAVRRGSEDPRQWKKDEPLACPCGWHTTWGELHRTYKWKQLFCSSPSPLLPPPQHLPPPLRSSPISSHSSLLR